MKKWISLFLLPAFVLQAFETIGTTDHYEMIAKEKDLQIAQELLLEAEEFHAQLEKDFECGSDRKVTITLYPDIDSFHEVTNPNAPAWSIATGSSDSFKIVSPLNAGSYHSEKSARKIFKLNVTKSFLYQLYGDELPYWFAFGVSSNKAHFITVKAIPQVLPTFEQLEDPDTVTFEKAGGYPSAHFFTLYLQEHYDWNEIINKLSTPESRKELYKEWLSTLSRT